MDNWNGEEISVIYSEGEVCAVVDPYDNLIKTNIYPWPPPEIVQKLYKSCHARDFKKEVIDKCSLGFYSDLQSLNSEDAITWSVFGTLKYSNKSEKIKFVESLLESIQIPTIVNNINIWLWRRIPHPDTFGLGGPEIDFGIQTDNLIVLGESKWLSNVGKAQGKEHDKDQIILRKEFLEKYGQKIFGNYSRFVILGVERNEKAFQEYKLEGYNKSPYFRCTTWESICAMESHPLHLELGKYFKWKSENSFFR